MTGSLARQGGLKGRIPMLALVMALAAGACSPGDPAVRADRFVDSATAALADGRIEAAVIELKNALQTKPDHAAARLLLGRVYSDTWRLAAAEKELERALESGASPDEVWPLLLRALVGQGKFAQALEAIDRLPVELAAAPGVRVSHADALLGQGLREEVRDLLGPADSMTDPRLLARLARLASLEGKPVEAQRLAARAAEMKGADAYVFLTHALIEAGGARWEPARAALRTAREMDPFSLEAGNAMAQTLIALGEIDAAEAVVEDLARRLGEQPALAHLRAVIAIERRDFAVAKAQAERVLGLVPDFRPAMLIAGIANSALGNHQTAITQLDPIASRPAAPAAALRALAWSNLRMGRPAAALRALESGEIASDDMASLRLAVTAALQSRDQERAESLLRAAMRSNPREAGLAAGLAGLHLASGDREAAQEVLSDLPEDLDFESNSEKVRLALVHLRAGNFEQALALAADLKADEASAATGHTIAGLAETALGQADVAVIEFEQALERAPANRAAALALASLHRREGRTADAERVLRAALEQAPADPRLLNVLAALRLASDDKSGAERLLADAVKANADSVAPKLVYARFLLTDNRAEEALPLAEAASALDRDRPDVLETLALAQQMSGRDESAVATLRRFVALRPEAAEPHFLLARSLAELGQPETAVRELREGLAIEPARYEMRLALVRLLSRRGELEEAGEELARLKGSAPPSAEILEMEGALLTRRGEYSEAAAAFRQAYELDPTPMRAVSLSRAQWGAGQRPEAIATLESVDAPVARLVLAQYYYQTGAVDLAKEQYRGLVETDRDNPVYHNDFAWILWETGELDAAYEHARRAVELAPDSPAVQDTYAVVLLDRGNIADAVTALRKAVEGAPDDPTIRLHLARALVEHGNAEEARPMLQALSEVEGFAGRSEAADLLLRIGG